MIESFPVHRTGVIGQFVKDMQALGFVQAFQTAFPRPRETLGIHRKWLKPFHASQPRPMPTVDSSASVPAILREPLSHIEEHTVFAESPSGLGNGVRAAWNKEPPTPPGRPDTDRDAPVGRQTYPPPRDGG